MAKPTKKTLEEIAAENNIDISEKNAQTVANNYIQPTIDAINQAEQKAIADTQAARKALENNYFKQYRNSMYNAQSRGLTGGLANMDTAQLRMQMGQANADLSKDLITAQTNAETNRGTALSTAENYKEDYLQKMMDKVIALRDKDYAERYSEWQYAEQLAQAQKEFEENQRRWQLEYNLSLDRYNMEKDQFNYEKSQREQESLAQKVQTQAYIQEYSNSILPNVANTYAAYMNSGDINKAAQYLGKTATQLSSDYGLNPSEIINQVHSVYNYNRTSNNAADYENTLKALRTNKNILTGGSGVLAGLSLAAAPFTGGLSLLGLIPSVAGTVGAVKSTNEYERYKNLLNSTEKRKDTLNSTLPSWYAQ